MNVRISNELLAILSSAKTTCNRHGAQVAVEYDTLSKV